ncbi:hypothetical protein Nepgr_004433 [Nepenthes gracilis]|uniref:Mediator-associated protein 2 n=1 Tax=Nepenthes gracilis TaxID=150966 RepID=A0AAD3XF39_NEPGR|nr:hypothetical protein Nepgr_004433 [Nepenthes gracilis]
MEVAHEDGYKPLPEFQEDTKDPLVELNMTDSTELWLIQWPIGQPPDFAGQEVTLTLNQDRELCSFEGPSGKLYKMVNFSTEEPKATVFHSTSSKSKIVGKISRRVSVVHYPDPSELEKLCSNDKGLVRLSSSKTSSSHRLMTPLQSSQLRNPKSGSSGGGTTSSGRQRSSLPQVEQLLKSSKRGMSAATSSASVDHSPQKKSKSKF